MKSFVYNVLNQLDLDAENKHRIGATTFANNVQVCPLMATIVHFGEQGIVVIKSKLLFNIQWKVVVVVYARICSFLQQGFYLGEFRNKERILAAVENELKYTRGQTQIR